MASLSRRQLLGGTLVGLASRRARAEESGSLDATARWLAGLGTGASAGRDPGDEWRAYAKLEGERWQTTSSRRKALVQWAAAELRSVLPKEPALFYPFAGPDVLHAVSLFPSAKRLVLVGLEPIGRVPAPGGASGLFPRLGGALADLHRLTFFRTQEMSSDFQKDGVLPALLAQIARLDGRVTGVEIARAATSPPAPASARIAWTTAEGESRRLDYVQADLSNAGLAAQPGVAAAIRAAAPNALVTFVKAAMYLLAEARFSTLRQLVLDESALVVEDDTGIPYHHFANGGRWATRLFGRYETPGTPFERFFQADLRAAFDRVAPPMLPFGIGYHVAPARSNLLVAAKGGG